MKLRLFSLLFAVCAFVASPLAHANQDFLKNFPPLQLTGVSKETAASFQAASTTKDLYNKYYGLARMLKSGNPEVQKKNFKDQLAKDLPYWKTEAARELKLPKKPDTKDKKIIKQYDTKVAKLQAAHDKKIEVASTYLNWLSVELPAWLKTVE